VSGSTCKRAEVDDAAFAGEMVPGDPVEETRFILADHARDGIDGLQVRESGAPGLRLVGEEPRVLKLERALRSEW